MSQKQINSRRNFLKGAISATAVVGTANISQVFAGDHNAMLGIVYSKENPGKWSKKVAGHLPSIKIDGDKVSVETDHGMSNKHYIVRHTLVSEAGETIGSMTFTPADEAKSSYTLPKGYKGKLYATSFCNKHDFWLAETSV